MNHVKRFRLPGISLLLMLMFLSVVPASAAPWSNRSLFANERFASQWARTDHELVRTNRTWYWGPAPWFDYYEFYRESPNGLRLVQYFDKARMEINDPKVGNVTNGLLVVEMVGGQQKLGDQPWDNAMGAPASIPVAGDPPATNPLAPTYASFASVATINDPTLHRDPERLGQTIGTTLDKAGNKGYRDELATTYAEQTRIVQYNTTTGHNIPAVFWSFLNQSGPIYVNGSVQSGPVVDWLAAMGYPITDPYWVRTKVGGVERDVLVQLFERRVLTYTPTNSPGYQVEMGNVGQHYFQWRYPHLGQAWAAEQPPLPIFFARTTDDGDWEIFRMSPNGDHQQQFVPSGTTGSVPYSIRRAYGDYSQLSLVFDSARGDGVHRQIYAASLANGSGFHRMSGYWPDAGNDYNGMVSPDGTKVAFVSDRTGQHQIFMMFWGGKAEVQLTFDDCVHQTPSWSPDGRALIWMANCDGDFEIYKGDLLYQEDSGTNTFYPWLWASLTNVTRLTDNDKNDQFPRYSPDGKKIAFQSDRDGNYEIYVMNADGSGQTRLTSSTGEDFAPSWSQDGQQLVFSSNRDGDWEIFKMNADGSGQTQLTNNTQHDHWVIWSQ